MELQIGIGGCAAVSSCVSIYAYTFLRKRGSNRLARLLQFMCRNERGERSAQAAELRDSDKQNVTRHEHLIFLGNSDARIVAWAATPWLAGITALGGVEQAVSDTSDLHHFRYIVDAHNMGSAEDAGGHRRSGGPEALLGR